MVGLRKEAEQTISLTEHLRIIEEKDHKIHQLEKRLRFREELDAVPAEVMSQNQKAALYTAVKAIETTKPDEKGRALLSNTDDLAKSAGQSLQTYQKNLTYCDKIVGNIKKETLKVRNKDGEVVRIETYVRPTILTYSPRSFATERPRNHGGGDRLRCEGCGSEKLEKRLTYVCTDCGKIHAQKPKPPETHDASMVNEQETESPESEATIVDSYIVPEMHDAFLVESAQKRNLTLEDSNNYPEDQVDSTVEGDSNIPPISSSAPADSDAIIDEWLGIRFGRMIKATEKLTQADKYKTLPEGYQPDIQAFKRGHLDHIYGSRLLSETGLTRVLCFDLDHHNPKAPDPQWLDQAQNWLLDFRRAGVTAVYWQRGKGGHFELYFDQPVRPERARYWAYSICPDLEALAECYPCQSIANKPVSWPMWQRREYTVNPTPAHVILPEPYEGGLQTIDPTDKERLAQLIPVAMTPASLVEDYAKQADALAEQKREQGKRGKQGGDIGIKPKPFSNGGGKDLVPRVVADFCAQVSWDDIATMAGGWHEGYFRATWRNERTPSVKPDEDGRYAKDWGNYGDYPEKLDKYGAYCLIKGIDQKADLRERCAELRRQQSGGQP